jgi:hypothetical protein
MGLMGRWISRHSTKFRMRPSGRPVVQRMASPMQTNSNCLTTSPMRLRAARLVYVLEARRSRPLAYSGRGPRLRMKPPSRLLKGSVAAPDFARTSSFATEEALAASR